MSSQKTTSLTPKKIWKSYPREAIQEAIQGLVHFSAKVTNSNTLAAGIRLPAEYRLELPYVAVTTLGCSSIPLDYPKNSGAVATIVKQLEAVIQDRVTDLFTEVPNDDVEYYRTSLEMTATPFEIGLEQVGKRMRQIIVQDNEGRDIVLTPMTCAGFSHLLENRLQEEEKTSNENFRQRPRGVLRIGGANPQNVGRHVRAAQHPLWFAPPVTDPALRAAFRLHYDGISLEAPAKLLAEFLIWRRNATTLHKNRRPMSPGVPDAEARFFGELAGLLLHRATEARALLQKYQTELPGQNLLDLSVPAEVRALIDPLQHYSGWKSQIAQRVLSILIEKEVQSDGVSDALDIDQTELSRWIETLEDSLI